MAREGRDQSGQRPPELSSPGRAAGRGVRPERFPQPCPRSAKPAGNSCLQPAAPDRPQGESGGRRSAPPRRTSPRAPPAPSFPLSPSHSRLLPPHSGKGKQKKVRPPGTGLSSSRSRRARSSIPGGRSRARGRRGGAIQRSRAGMLPRRPEPLSACRPRPGRFLLGGWTHVARLSALAPAPAWRGVARISAAARPVLGRPLARSWGPESPAGGGVRRRLQRAGAAEWTAPRPPAWDYFLHLAPGLGPGGRRGRRRETLEGGRGRRGRSPGGRGWAQPDNAPGGQSLAEGLGPASPPPLPRATVGDRATKAEPPGPASLRCPSPAAS